MKPRISDPCHEDWNNMLPNAQGAFCSQCMKNVTDFSKMSDAEIARYLSDRKGEKVCGRFRVSQVEKPSFRKTFRFKAMQFLAAVFLAFGSFLFTACNESHAQVVKGNTEKIEHQEEPGAPDTLRRKNDSMASHRKKEQLKDTVVEVPEPMIMGGISYRPEIYDLRDTLPQ